MANLNSGSLTALSQTIESGGIENFGTVGVIISGTWVGTLTFEGSLNGIDFVPILAQKLSTTELGTTTIGNGQFITNAAGLKTVRINATAWTSGTANIAIQANSAIALNRSLTTVAGATDGTKTGNVGDRLKVDANISAVGGGVISAFSSKMRVDALTTSIPITSLTVYTTIYSYNGSGYLLGFNAEFNNSAIVVKLVIDGQIIFDGLSIADYNGFNSTADTNSGRQAGNGIKSNASAIDWSLKLPVAFNSNVTISAKVATGGLLTRSFQQGIVYIDKET